MSQQRQLMLGVENATRPLVLFLFALLHHEWRKTSAINKFPKKSSECKNWRVSSDVLERDPPHYVYLSVVVISNQPARSP